MRALATVGLLVGCGYQPGSFHSAIVPFDGQLATIGCLDLAIDRRPDLSTGHAVIAYAFGNRCDFPTIVDLAAHAVVGRGSNGEDVALETYDPSHVITPLHIDGRAVGREAVAYISGAPLRELCVDAGAIAHGGGSTWLCFSNATRVAEVP
jgi:hypothetical protein